MVRYAHTFARSVLARFARSLRPSTSLLLFVSLASLGQPRPELEPPLDSELELFSAQIEKHFEMITAFQQSAYFAAVDTFYNEKLRADLAEFQAVKNKWWYYLPSVGFQFGFPSVNLNSSVLKQIDYENQKRKLKIDQIQKQNEYERKLTFNEVANLTVQYSELLLQFQIKKYGWRLKEKQFTFYKVAYVNEEITPLDFIKQQEIYVNEILTLLSDFQRLIDKRNELEKVSHYHFNQI